MPDNPRSSDVPPVASPSPKDPPTHFEPIVAHNINVLLQKRAKEQKSLSFEERIAEAITRFSGSMKFVYLHLALFTIWIAWNKLPLHVPQFDPELIILAMWASVEAIFLSTFILISQNRQTLESDRRADLDLQVNLLAEHELSRLINLVVEMADHMGIDTTKDPDLVVAQRDVHPEQVLEQIEKSQDKLARDA